MRLELLSQKILFVCSVEGDVADCGKVARNSDLFWPSHFPSGCVAIQLNVGASLYSAWRVLAMASCVHKVRKGKQGIKIQSTKKAWRIVIPPICKLGMFYDQTPCKRSFVSTARSAPTGAKFQSPKTQWGYYIIGNGKIIRTILGEVNWPIIFPLQIEI